MGTGDERMKRKIPPKLPWKGGASLRHEGVKLENVEDPEWDSSFLEKSISMERGRARALQGSWGRREVVDGWAAMGACPAAAAPALVCCRQLPARQGSCRHESPWQGAVSGGRKNEKSLQLLNSWGMKKPLLTAVETESFKHRDDLEPLEF